MPKLGGKPLGELTRADIEGFADYLASLSISGKTKNGILQAGTTALKFAYKKGYIEGDITAGVFWFSNKPQTERKILETDEAERLLYETEWADKTALLASKLAMIVGLRAGEIRALKKDCVKPAALYITEAWGENDEFKSTKNTETRLVSAPPRNYSRIKRISRYKPA